jgi:hypothetical protein
VYEVRKSVQSDVIEDRIARDWFRPFRVDFLILSTWNSGRHESSPFDYHEHKMLSNCGVASVVINTDVMSRSCWEQEIKGHSPISDRHSQLGTKICNRIQTRDANWEHTLVTSVNGFSSLILDLALA